MPRVFVLPSFVMKPDTNTSETSKWQIGSWRVGLVGTGQPGSHREGTRRNLVLRRTCSGHEESCTEEGSREEGSRQEGTCEEGSREEGSCEEEVGRRGKPFDCRPPRRFSLLTAGSGNGTTDNNEKGPSQQTVGAALMFALWLRPRLLPNARGFSSRIDRWYLFPSLNQLSRSATADQRRTGRRPPSRARPRVPFSVKSAATSDRAWRSAWLFLVETPDEP